MAYIEFNALSVCLGGSFTASVFAPELKDLKKNETLDKLYPVLYLIHDDGGDSTDFRGIADIEKMASEYGIYIIAPSISHSFCLDMDYGPEYEKFVAEEFSGICRNMFSVKGYGEGVYIGGIGTGAYGAAMLAMKHKEMFAKCITLNGQFDVVSMCKKAASGEELPFETPKMMEAIFGPLNEVKDSEKDIFKVVKEHKDISLYMSVDKNSPYYNENVYFAKETGCELKQEDSLSKMLKNAISWLME